MLKMSVCRRWVACLLVMTVAIPSRAEDELDPAFDQSGAAGPREIIPENYPRSDWDTRYVADATRYLEAHPAEPFAPRMYFDLMMVAQELDNRELEHRSLKTLIFEYPRSIQARYAVASIHKPSEFLQLIKYCLADGEYSAKTLWMLIPIVEFGSKKWGGRLWSHDREALCTAILCSLALDTLETQTALEQEFSKPGQWDRQHLLETLRDIDSPHEQLIAAIFDSGVDLAPDQAVLSASESSSVPDFKEFTVWQPETSAWTTNWEKTVELFLPELGRRLQADGTEEFVSATAALQKLDKEQNYEEFLTQISTLLERYPSRRLEWTRILTLANLGRFEEARTAATSLNQNHPRSVWSSQALELTGTFDGADELRREQAELLAAVADKYRESHPAQLRIKLFHSDFRTIEGNLIPPGSLIAEYDRNRGSALAAKMGDELLLKMTLGADDRLRLFLPSLDRSQIFVHDGDFSHYATVWIKCSSDPERGVFACRSGAHADDEDQRRGCHCLQFGSSFSKDKAGYEEFLALMQKHCVYPVSRRKDGETIEITWKAFYPFKSHSTDVRWRSTADGDETSVAVVQDFVSMKGGLTISWGDENSNVFSGIELPELPERVLPVLNMLPEYYESIMWSAHKTGLLAEHSDGEVAQFLKMRKTMMNAYRLVETYKNPTRASTPLASFETIAQEFVSRESEQDLKRKYGSHQSSEQKSTEDKCDGRAATFLEYALPGNPNDEINKKLKNRK